MILKKKKITFSIILCVFTFLAMFFKNQFIEHESYVYYVTTTIIYLVFLVPALLIFRPYKTTFSNKQKIKKSNLITMVLIMTIIITLKLAARIIIINDGLIDILHTEFGFLKIIIFIIGAAFEETIFRYLMQGGLKEKGLNILLCILISSVMFSTCHMIVFDIHEFIIYILWGLIYGIIYELSNENLLCNTIFHFVCNLTMLF